MQGLVHIYCGDGKGKTTAAVGLAVRAAAAGKRVLFAQFFKDGSSSELRALRALPDVEVRVCQTPYGFFKFLSEEQRARAAADYTALLREVLDDARDGGFGLLVLDEIMSACNSGAVPEAEVLSFLDTRPETLEVVMTGRDPSEAMCARADYITEMRKLRHPYDRGINAREGIEY